MQWVRGRVIIVQGGLPGRGEIEQSFEGRTGDPQVKKGGRKGSNKGKEMRREMVAL